MKVEEGGRSPCFRMCKYLYRINSARRMDLSRAEAEREGTHKLYSRIEQPDRTEEDERRKKPESGRQGCVAARAML